MNGAYPFIRFAEGNPLKLHFNPECKKLSMNCRWKMRKSSKSGPTTITVPAVTRGHCAPI